jgi:hypothetical protein
MTSIADSGSLQGVLLARESGVDGMCHCADLKNLELVTGVLNRSSNPGSDQHTRSGLPKYSFMAPMRRVPPELPLDN